MKNEILYVVGNLIPLLLKYGFTIILLIVLYQILKDIIHITIYL